MLLPILFEQAEERKQVNGGFKDKHSFALAPVAEVKGFVAAFHIKAEVSRRSLAVGVARYKNLTKEVIKLEKQREKSRTGSIR